MFDWLPRPEGDNAIGLHDDGNAGDGAGTIGFMYGLIDGMADLGFTWIKILMNVNHKSGRLPLVERARQKGLMVIARPFRQPCHPRGLDLYDDFLKALIGAGCPYIEVGNEPNLAAVECWKPYDQYKYNGVTGHAAFVNLLYDQWLRNADKIRRLGGIPLFPAMSPTAYTSNDVYFHHQIYDDILGLGKLRGNLAWAFEGAGVAVHNRPCDGLPLDVMDRCGFRDYENIERKFRDALGREIPLFGTEAGYEDGMVGDYIKHQLGNLYPNNQDYIHWHKVLNHELYARFNPEHPKAWHDYLICQCAWLGADDGWYASGWARNARVGGGPLPTYTDMGQISNFTRAEGTPWEPPQPPIPDPPDPEPQPPSDEVEFVGLSEEMIEHVTICGPNDPSLPYWKVYRVEVQPQTNNMSAFAVLPPGTEVGVQFWNGGQFNAAPKADVYAPPGAKAWAASMPLFNAWGGYGVTVLANSEAIHGFGLYGDNLELTHTSHHPTLIFFHKVDPSEPEPPEPPEPPDPEPDIPYSLLAGLERLGLAVDDVRDEVKAISRIDEIPIREFGDINGIVVHHTGSNGPQSVMGIAEMHINERGWPTIGYHFVIDFDGTVAFAAPLKWEIHDCGELNPEVIGIAMMGDFTNSVPESSQIRSLRLLIYGLWEFLGQGWGQYRVTYVLPHSYLSYVDDQGNLWHSACPGKLKEMLVWEGGWPSWGRL